LKGDCRKKEMINDWTTIALTGIETLSRLFINPNPLLWTRYSRTGAFVDHLLLHHHLYIVSSPQPRRFRRSLFLRSNNFISLVFAVPRTKNTLRPPPGTHQPHVKSSPIQPTMPMGDLSRQSPTPDTAAGPEAAMSRG
jgi:hypothetical protein